MIEAKISLETKCSILTNTVMKNEKEKMYALQIN